MVKKLWFAPNVLKQWPKPGYSVTVARAHGVGLASVQIRVPRKHTLKCVF